MTTDPTQPIGRIRPQLLNQLPANFDATLVNDPVALVNDPNALVNSPVTQVAEFHVKTKTNAPKAYIQARR